MITKELIKKYLEYTVGISLLGLFLGVLALIWGGGLIVAKVIATSLLLLCGSLLWRAVLDD